jgi:DNA-binding LacI/PurR family transcriptional regulator
MAVGIDRLVGYREAIAEAGLPVDRRLEAYGEFTQESGAAAMARLLAVRPDIDGVFAASDLMAAGALSVLAEAGRRVPADVAVVGFDDSLVATSTNPQLTSVHQPIEEMGQEAARLLAEAVDGRSRATRSVTLATAVVERASSAGRSSP